MTSEETWSTVYHQKGQKREKRRSTSANTQWQETDKQDSPSGSARKKATTTATKRSRSTSDGAPDAQILMPTSWYCSHHHHHHHHFLLSSTQTHPHAQHQPTDPYSSAPQSSVASYLAPSPSQTEERGSTQRGSESRGQNWSWSGSWNCPLRTLQKKTRRTRCVCGREWRTRRSRVAASAHSTPSTPRSSTSARR